VLIYRYLARELLIVMFAVTTVLLLIIMSGRFVKYLAQAASGEIAGEVLFAIMFYRLPGFLELTLPLGLFIAIMLAYGRLYVESEMVVMSACGVSNLQLLIMTLLPVICLASVVGFLSLYLAPLGASKVEQILEVAGSESNVSTIVPGRFQNYTGRRQVSYTESLSGETGRMSNIFIADAGGKDNPTEQLSIVVAESGRIETSENEQRYLVLENGYRYEGAPGQLDFMVVSFDTYTQLITERSQDKERRKLKADARSTGSLWDSKDLEDKAALHWRLSLPLLVPIVAIIALALSKTDHRRGRYVRILPAILIYICYLVALNGARSAIEEGSLPQALGLWWVHGLFFALAVLLFCSADIGRYWRYQRRIRS
jgi:lipopolysaccharide export system permease protein